MISPAVQLDDILCRLPADLTSLIDTAGLNPESFSYGNIILRLTITLLNETDKRISNMDTKIGVLVLFSVLVRQSPSTKRFIRRILQNFRDWIDEEISDEEKIGEYALIIQKIKILFSNIWSIPNDLARSISMDKNESIEVAKTRIINHYAASQFQAISRGFVNRIHVRRRLKAEAENHLVAVRSWSIQKIQKVARGFIARKAHYRSRAIRSELSRDVLRMAEKYLLKGDLWGFLRDIDDEMKRAQREAREVRQQEDDMAGRFVEKVVQLRQTEFDDAWKKFPQAVATFSGQKVEHSIQQPPIRDANSSSQIVPTTNNSNFIAKKETRIKTEQRATYHVDAASVSSQSLGNTTTLPSPIPHGNSSTTSTQSEFSPDRQLSSSVSAKSTFSSAYAKSVTGNASVASLDADPSVSLPGPLLRHAVAATVSGEVQRQLDYLLSGPHKSKQLLQDMKEAYSSSLPGSVSVSNHPNGRKKKKAVIGSDGRVVDAQENKMSAAHSDWMSTAAATTSGAASTAASVQPGNSLLLDVPQGSQDSIERILYAAALRCYVPEFFRGHTDPDSFNPNEHPDYAYKMFLKLPHGLAKMKYELECKKWAQGPINRLKIKGLIYLTDTLPVSRFVMSLRSVETPKILETKAVELVSLLLKMGKPAIGNRDLHAAKHMTQQPHESTTKPLTPQEHIGKNKHKKHLEDGDGEKQLEEKSVSTNESNSNSPADELGEQLLLNMLDASGSSSWCSLTASIEDLFLQAAFLVVPNAETYNNHHANDGSQEMGNAAFRSFCVSLQSLVAESSRRDAVRRRFRSSFILVTPFCLHLKNAHHIHTVQQLLAKGLDVVLESESGVPPALFTQLEILLGQVVGRCVAAKTVPVPRAQQVRAPDLFTVPMIYDPKFQRSPFDPFGKPPRLHVKVKNRSISGDKSHAMAGGGEEAAASVAHDGKKMKSVPSFSSLSIASDLTEPVSLWGTGSGLVSPAYKASSADSQWSFHLSPAKADQSSIVEENSMASISSESYSSNRTSPTRSSKRVVASHAITHALTAPSAELEKISQNMNINERDHHDLVSLRLDQHLQRTEHSSSDSSLYQDVAMPVYRVLNPIEDRLTSPTMRVTSYNATAAQRLKNQSRGNIRRNSNSGGGATVSKNHRSGEIGQGAFICGGVEAHLYKNTFKCTYPHCHQVFSRAYTYKIHLRSHEMFPQYHEFKKKPQLVLDPDKKQVKDIGTEMYTRKVSLPPIVQSDLHSLR